MTKIKTGTPLPSTWSERTIVQHGVILPYTYVIPARHNMDGQELPQETKSGEVFIPSSMLYALAEQDTWDSEFGSPFLLGPHEGYALVQAGLAVQETRGGFHRSDTLQDYLNLLEKNSK